jgi:hypothetical protein
MFGVLLCLVCDGQCKYVERSCRGLFSNSIPAVAIADAGRVLKTSVWLCDVRAEISFHLKGMRNRKVNC